MGMVTLPRSLTTVTSFSKALALLLFVLLPFFGVAVGIAYQQKISSLEKKEENSASLFRSSLPNLDASGSMVLAPPGDPHLITRGKQVYFVDSKNKYFLDLSLIPQVSLTDPDLGDIYEFEMYPKQGPSQTSVGRFGLSAPMDIPAGQTVGQFAAMRYADEIQTQSSGGWGELEASPVKNEIVGNGYEAVSWTRKNPGQSGYFFKYYVVKVNERAVFINLISWKRSIFTTNEQVLGKILSTFQIF